MGPAAVPHLEGSHTYVRRAVEVMLPFVEPDLDEITLTHLCTEAYASFRHPAVVPLVQIGQSVYIQGDKEVRFGRVMEVMDAVIAAGLDAVADF